MRKEFYKPLKDLKDDEHIIKKVNTLFQGSSDQEVRALWRYINNPEVMYFTKERMKKYVDELNSVKKERGAKTTDPSIFDYIKTRLTAYITNRHMDTHQMKLLLATILKYPNFLTNTTQSFGFDIRLLILKKLMYVISKRFGYGETAGIYYMQNRRDKGVFEHKFTFGLGYIMLEYEGSTTKPYKPWEIFESFATEKADSVLATILDFQMADKVEAGIVPSDLYNNNYIFATRVVGSYEVYTDVVTTLKQLRTWPTIIGEVTKNSKGGESLKITTVLHKKIKHQNPKPPNWINWEKKDFTIEYPKEFGEKLKQFGVEDPNHQLAIAYSATGSSRIDDAIEDLKMHAKHIREEKSELAVTRIQHQQENKDLKKNKRGRSRHSTKNIDQEREDIEYDDYREEYEKSFNRNDFLNDQDYEDNYQAYADKRNHKYNYDDRQDANEFEDGIEFLTGGDSDGYVSD